MFGLIVGIVEAKLVAPTTTNGAKELVLFFKNIFGIGISFQWCYTINQNSDVKKYVSYKVHKSSSSRFILDIFRGKFN